MPAWTATQLADHQKAADALAEIKDAVFSYIFTHPETTEYEAQKLIFDEFARNNLTIEKEVPIVAFGPNTSSIHYYPTADRTRQLQPGDLIMLDIWARPNKKEAPYADITWMGCNSEMTKKMQLVYAVVLEARDAALILLEKSLRSGRIPAGREVDAASRDIINKAGFGETFTHTTGHSLGFHSPHGLVAGINKTNALPLITNLGYTIEPGVYLKDEFGVRSEIDFYISDELKLVLTTPVQRSIVSPTER